MVPGQQEEMSLDRQLWFSMDKDHTAEGGADDLIRRGADPEYSDSEWQTLLHRAAIAGNIGNMEWLVNTYRMDIMEADEGGNTPAHLAAWAGHVDAVAWLVERGADITLRNYDNTTVQGMLLDSFPIDVVEVPEQVVRWNEVLGENYPIRIEGETGIGDVAAGMIVVGTPTTTAYVEQPSFPAVDVGFVGFETFGSGL